MNVYLLVEGRSTEKKVYPKLFEYFFDGVITKVNQVDAIEENNFYLLSANGYPRIFTDVLKNSILDINNVGKYNYLIICIDSDETSVNDRFDELNGYLEEFEADGITLNSNCKLELVVQHRCIESWFLGNRKVYKNNPSSNDLVQYQKFYDVSSLDPELMPIFNGFDTHAGFHFSYLREMLLERNVRYTKNFPRDVAEPHYIKELISRGEDGDIQSFMNFCRICSEIKNQIT